MEANKKKTKQHAKPSHKEKPKSGGTSHWKLWSFLKNNVILSSILAIVLVAFVLKYYGDVHALNSRFIKVNVDIYKVLGVAKDANEVEIRTKYRELSLKWHPDKNKDCVDCEKKFRELKEAYRIILNPYLKEIYDNTNGLTVNIIPSKTTNLTSKNYNHLVKGSNKVWVIQAYSDDNYYCKAFAPLWDEFAEKYRKYANFGRINVLLDKGAIKKLPAKVQVYPAIFMILPNGSYDIFPTASLDNEVELTGYFESVYPSAVKEYGDYNKFKESKFPGPKLLFYTKDVPILLNFISLKYKQFEVAHLSQDAHADGLKEDVQAAFPDADTSGDTLCVLYNKEGKVTAASNRNLGRKTLDLVSKFQMLVDPLLEVSQDNFDSLCAKDGGNDKVCALFLGHEHLDSTSLVGLLAKYDKFDKIWHKHASSEDNRGESTTDVQLATLSEPVEGVVDTGVLLLDHAKGRFCVISKPGQENEYDCGWENVNDYSWINSLSEGDFSALDWFDLPENLKGDLFKRNGLKSHTKKSYF